MYQDITSIEAPYNFVPLSDKIYIPSWGKLISHDIPFSDGESGFLEFEIEAYSDIFVRDSSQEEKHMNVNEKYFIPGSSLKGMIRNVLEIMSFSKMQFVDNRKYSWRNLGNKEQYSQKFSKDFHSEPLVKAGFLKYEEGSWYLIPCKMARIEQSDIHENIGLKNFKSASQKYNFLEKNKEEIEKKWGVKINEFKSNFEIKEASCKNFNKQCGKLRRATFKNQGKPGQIVFTGQIAERKFAKQKKVKHLEFVFFDEEEGQKIKLSPEMCRDFELNHTSTRNKAKHQGALNPNEEWGRWSEKFKKEETLVPIFWLGNNTQVESFGMAMLYRLPYKNSIHDIIQHTNREHTLEESSPKIDLCEAIFGYISKNDSLKGRVQFSHAFCTHNAGESQKKHEVLSSPKPTFYHTYLKSNNKEKIVPYNQKESKISGWKRYPIHTDIKTNFTHENQNIATSFTPLLKGSSFLCQLHFHNLRKIELGALLAAITWAGKEECFHSLGMAKPLGYGKVKLKITNISSENLKMENINKYIHSFIEEIEKNINIGKWEETSQIKNLFYMTYEPQHPKINNSLIYMELDKFIDIKRNETKNPPYFPYYQEKPEYQKKDLSLKLFSSSDFNEMIESFLQNKDSDKFCDFYQKNKENNDIKQIIIPYLTKFPYNKRIKGLCKQYIDQKEILYFMLDHLDLNDSKNSKKELKEILKKKDLSIIEEAISYFENKNKLEYLEFIEGLKKQNN